MVIKSHLWLTAAGSKEEVEPLVQRTLAIAAGLHISLIIRFLLLQCIAFQVAFFLVFLIDYNVELRHSFLHS